MALSMWRGAAYAEFAHEGWAAGEAARLSELFTTTSVSLVGHLLMAARWPEAIDRILSVIESEPFRDQPRAQLMQALAGVGRRTDAIREFSRYRQFLLDEVGIEPSRELFDLERQIVLGENTPAEAPVREPRIQRVRAHKEIPADWPKAIPRPTTALVGRTGELEAVERQLDQNRLVTLVGPGGCGKTRLAQHLAVALLDRGVSVTWVDLASIGGGGSNPAGEVIDQTLGAIGADVEAGATKLDRITASLASDPNAVLVLDNAEHLVNAVADFVDEVLARAPRSRVVLTSRQILGLSNESVFSVPALSLPPMEAGDHARLEDFDATQLFMLRARAARPGLSLSKDDTSLVTTICRRLEGMALAIEFAAARVRHLPLSEIEAGLDDAMTMLQGRAAGAVPRQRTIEASVAWSIRLLDASTQVVLGRLTVLRASFTLETARAVVADGQVIEARDVIPELTRLVDHSLVRFDDFDGRYHMLETVRQYANKHILQPEEVAATRRRHAEHFAQYCTEVGRGERGIERAPILLEMPHIVEALRWSRNHSAETAFAICSGLSSFRSALGYHSDLVETWRWITKLEVEGSHEQSWLTAIAALLAPATGAGFDVSRLVGLAEARLAPGSARARGWLARGASMGPAYRGDLDPICRYASSVIERRDDPETSIYVGFAAYMAVLVGRLDDAASNLDAVRSMARRHDAPFTVDNVGNAFAAAILYRLAAGDHIAARELDETKPLGSAFSITAAAALAQAAISAQDPELYAVADQWARAGTIKMLEFQVPLVRLYGAILHRRTVDAADAAEVFWHESSVVPVSRLHQVPAVVRAMIADGRTEAAAEVLTTAEALLAKMRQVPLLECNLSLGRAEIASASGDRNGAATHAYSLLKRAVDGGFTPLVVDALELLAIDGAAPNNSDIAARLFRCAQHERDRCGLRWSAVGSTAERAQLLAAARSAELISVEAAVELAAEVLP